MKTLNEAVALRMKCRGELMFNPTLFAQSLPGRGGELRAPVADDGGRKSED